MSKIQLFCPIKLQGKPSYGFDQFNCSHNSNFRLTARFLDQPDVAKRQVSIEYADNTKSCWRIE